ncbi:MAG: hypothetical protein R3264_21180, partial [Anaerolineae bacterium]|nr:hypothetical protein [Anaerolineae bacterium]
ARYGILVVVGLTALAGWGVAYLLSSRHNLPLSHRTPRPGMLVFGLTALILLESWSAPLIGPEFPAGEQIAPVYHWLRQATPPETVVLELPYQGASEFIYEYYSSYHWRHLANGGTGFTPPIYKELRQWFNAFPDSRSVDVIRQLGIDLVILHSDSYTPDEWQRVLAALPLYLPAIERIDQIGRAVVLHMAPPTCRPEPGLVQVDLAPTGLDGLSNAVEVTYHNHGPAAFVADVQQTGALTFNNGTGKNFTEPLVTPAGETQSVIIPLQHQISTDLSQARLPGLDRTIPAGQEPPSGESSIPAQVTDELQWQPLGLQFAEGPRLAAFSLSPSAPTACDRLAVALDWTDGQPGDTALLQLLDPFGQVVAESAVHPWLDQVEARLDIRTLPLPGSLPAGRYGLRISVRHADGSERWPITEEGVTIPPDQIPPLPVTIHPAPRPVTGDEFALTSPPLFDGIITLTGRKLAQDRVSVGGWLRFSLTWQIDRSLDEPLTVFTQLIGPDGQVWGQQDNRPGGGWYDVSLWPPGQPVVDDYAFQIQPDAPPGTYRLIAGLYRSDTLARLTTQTGADFVEIGSVVVE